MEQTDWSGFDPDDPRTDAEMATQGLCDCHCVLCGYDRTECSVVNWNTQYRIGAK